jgi:hypothetical protein
MRTKSKRRFYKTLVFIAIPIIIFGLIVNLNKTEEKPEGEQNIEQLSTAQEPIEPILTDPASTSKFQSPQDLITQINSSMGLGTMNNWTHLAGGVELGQYISDVEYPFGPKEQFTEFQNVIELSLESTSASRSFVESIKITVGFMNPSAKTDAKTRYLNKIKILSTILNVEIPDQVNKAIREERPLDVVEGNYLFTVEKYGNTRDWISLTIK